MGYVTIESEGLLISPEVLQKIAAGEADGQKPADFGLDNKTRFMDEMASCWSDALAYWDAFQHALSRQKEGDSGATATREQWILPLLRTLGFGKLAFCKSAAQVGGQTFFLSHRDGTGEDGLPVHIEGANIGMDTRPPSGTPRISPQALVQEYLNRTEHLWGIVTNGLQFRLLRDSTRMSRSTYLEFDLEQMLKGNHFAEFQLFYRLVHRSRWPAELDSAPSCLLEKYYQQSIEEGGRIREHLREGVEAALEIFGNGFLQHPDNTGLVNKIKKGELTAIDFYSQLLRLVYRFLFLMVAEDRKLAGPDPTNEKFFNIYNDHYSIRRIRRRVERHFNPQDRYYDVWEAVRRTFGFYSSRGAAEKLGMAALDGGLFSNTAMPDLDDAHMFNRDFLRGFAKLSLFKDNNIIRPINYGGLDVEELGSVYESLLDLHPQTPDRDGKPVFEFTKGSERKTTGSYYTRPELVQELIKSALEPVILEHLSGAKSKEDKEKALLSVRVCDPASGSGHFLLAAARRIGRELAMVRTGEQQPPPALVRLAVRDVIRHCIYGVDFNPLAADLCRVALWLEGHYRGMPLAFLDHRIKSGNSLVGVDSIERLNHGIPDDAFKPVTGDDKEAAKKIKAQNKKERERLASGQILLTPNATGKLEADLQAFADETDRLEALDENEVDDISEKQGIYARLHAGEAWLRDWTACHIWTAAFYQFLLNADDPTTSTQGKLVQYINNPKAVDSRLAGEATASAYKYRFFHWPLEFPEVTKAGGFDVVLSNPPWERIKLQEKEFFTQHDSSIARAPNKAAREKMIKELTKRNPTLLKAFEEAKHTAEAESRFVRASERFPLTATGDINLYALFTELSKNLINPGGRVGLIIPIGLAIEDTLKDFFNELVFSKTLVSFFGMENEALFYFPHVHHSMKFALACISGRQINTESPKFTFSCRFVEHTHDSQRQFETSSKDLTLINPNTHTMPVFRTKVDLELTKKIYSQVPVLVNEVTGQNPWGTKFMTMFHMSNDSHLFATEPKLGYLPLYEAKFVSYYDHRFGSYETRKDERGFIVLPDTSIEQYQDPNYQIRPYYWVDKREVQARLMDWKHGWLLGFKNVTAVTNMHTAIFSIIPMVGVGNSMPLIFVDKIDCISCFLANLSCILIDYIARQKIGGSNLNFHYVKQFPILPPSSFNEFDQNYINPRVLELTFTAYDLKLFAEDMGYSGPPFKWDTERRALLKAELDAYYARLYGLSRDELRYILDPQDIYGPDFPGETFRVLKNKETKEFGEYRTRRLVLEAWDKLEKGELK